MTFKRTAHRRRPAAMVLAALILAVLGTVALAQRDRGFGRFRAMAMPKVKNTAYDGRFTFVRINYDTAPGGYWYRGQPAWSHGYPVAEENLMKIMNEVSFLGANDAKFNTLTLDDPELFKYPLAYLIEVSWWKMTNTEAAALRAYIQKGGFVIVDDFHFQDWSNFETQMLRAMPEARFFDLDLENQIFHTFFEIKTLDVPQYYDPPPPKRRCASAVPTLASNSRITRAAAFRVTA